LFWFMMQIIVLSFENNMYKIQLFWNSAFLFYNAIRGSDFICMLDIEFDLC
jgi:hypothetical protein